MPATLAADALTSLEATIAFLGIEPEDVTDRLEDVLTRLINSASGFVRDNAAREFVSLVPADTIRRFEWDGSNILRIEPFDLRAGTTHTITDETTDTAVELVAGTDYRAKPIHAPAGVYDRIMLARCADVGPLGGVIAIEGTWGFPTVPDEIVDAVHRIVDAVFDRDLAVASESFDDVPSSIDSARIPFDVVDTCTRWSRGVAAFGA